jgi:hypothetical protein
MLNLTKEFIKETILMSPLATLLSDFEIEEVVEDIYQRYCCNPASHQYRENHKAGINGEPALCQ